MHTYDVNADIVEFCKRRVDNSGGYPRHIVALFVANTKAQVLLGGCSNLLRRTLQRWCVGFVAKTVPQSSFNLIKNKGVIVHEWLWAGMIALASLSFSASTDLRAAWCPSEDAQWGWCAGYEHAELPSVVTGEGGKWVQWFLDPILIQACTATGEHLEDAGGDEKKGMPLEQTAPAEWVKSEGWYCGSA